MHILPLMQLRRSLHFKQSGCMIHRVKVTVLPKIFRTYWIVFYYMAGRTVVCFIHCVFVTL